MPRTRSSNVYTRNAPEVVEAALAVLSHNDTLIALNRFADLALDALSLASIYFLAAIGLAITFGVMGVINMAHGEFIMMGAYTGYVVQLFVPDYTVSILVALPLRLRRHLRRRRGDGAAGDPAGSTTARWKRCWPPSASPSRCSRSPRTSSARRPAR